MTTHNDPMLPTSDHNDPMISGRGTKIIADARGAYLAGNLEALVELMDNDQNIRLREVLWIEARRFVQLFLSKYYRGPTTHHPIFEALSHILAAPSLEVAGKVAGNVSTESYGRVDEVDGPVWGLHSLSLMLAAITSNPDFMKAAWGFEVLIEYTDDELRPITMRERHNLIKKWLCDSTWNILQGKEPPPFELPNQAG